MRRRPSCSSFLTKAVPRKVCLITTTSRWKGLRICLWRTAMISPQDRGNHAANTSATATAATAAPASQQTWQERLDAWIELIQKDELKEMAEADRTKYEIAINPYQLSWNTAMEMEQAEEQPPREWVFRVSWRWWKHRPKMPYTYFMSKVESLERFVWGRKEVAAVRSII